MPKFFKFILSIDNLNYIICFFILDLSLIIGLNLANINISIINFDYKEEIKSKILQNEEFPMFYFYIGLDPPSHKHIYYDSFFTWQGTMKNNKQDLKPVKINKIFNNKFFYEKSNKTYFDYLKISAKEGENCKENYKKCGLLDSNKNILCLPIDEECPLNDIKISDIELTDILPEYNHIELIESITGIKKYIYFTNNKIDKNIITYFELSLDNPCISPNENSWISVNANEKEKTSNCHTYINETLYDQSFIEVGNNILMKSLYYDNNINIFNEFSSEKVKLYSRNYYYINEECANTYINDYIIYEKNKNNFINEIKIFDIGNLFLIIFHFIFIIFGLKNKTLKFMIFLNIIILFLIVTNIILFSNLNNDKILSFSCGGEEINAKIKYFLEEKIFSFKKPKLFIFIILVLSIIQIAFQNIVFYFIKKNKNERRLYIKSDVLEINKI